MVLTLAGLELGCRMWRGPWLLWHWSSFVTDEFRNFEQEIQGQFVRDPLLGWAPRPEYRSPDLNYDAEGRRRMPALADNAHAPILTTGDSFAVGEEVADDESWPAFLQGLLQRRVVNAGVGGYGLDQTVLRTEQQVAALRPSVIVVAFIADDLRRIEMRRLWGSEKPYFSTSSDGALVLHKVPVPGVEAPSEHLSFWQRAFGWSMLINTITYRIGWHDEWSNRIRRALPEGAGKEMICPLMQRLAVLAIPTVVVAQYDPVAELGEQRQLTRLVLDCAAASGLGTLDTFEAVANAVSEHGIDRLYRNEHHTAQGNRVVAGQIAAELARREMLR
jgi:hypothetical protein